MKSSAVFAELCVPFMLDKLSSSVIATKVLHVFVCWSIQFCCFNRWTRWIGCAIALSHTVGLQSHRLRKTSGVALEPRQANKLNHPRRQTTMTMTQIMVCPDESVVTACYSGLKDVASVFSQFQVSTPLVVTRIILFCCLGALGFRNPPWTSSFNHYLLNVLMSWPSLTITSRSLVPAFCNTHAVPPVCFLCLILCPVLAHFVVFRDCLRARAASNFAGGV